MSGRTVPGSMPVAFRYTPGVANTRSLEALRDRGVLLGSRCDACAVTVFPARIFCERCLGETPTEVECSHEGILDSWTLGHVDVDGRPLTEPVMLGLIRLDGVDSILVHRLIDVDRPDVGLRVRARLAPDRTASILDLEGFTPA